MAPKWLLLHGFHLSPAARLPSCRSGSRFSANSTAERESEGHFWSTTRLSFSGTDDCAVFQYDCVAGLAIDFQLINWKFHRRSTCAARCRSGLAFSPCQLFAFFGRGHQLPKFSRISIATAQPV
ncbi:hypothetical protein B0H63DRAFT_470417 [Podospora didyma]|uniref:Uncharacterized protein n=1 Tax=Podospora didyma TaxID=330526 RepID=A0AAE0U1X7_9PEZI|nr:hypothetical protein B0H63DRAFT_470417 [Podospora didyma]